MESVCTCGVCGHTDTSRTPPKTSQGHDYADEAQAGQLLFCGSARVQRAADSASQRRAAQESEHRWQSELAEGLKEPHSALGTGSTAALPEGEGSSRPWWCPCAHCPAPDRSSGPCFSRAGWLSVHHAHRPKELVAPKGMPVAHG